MQLTELAQAVIKQLNLVGHEATVSLVMPGRWGKSDTKRLCPGGPKGRIMAETSSGVLVHFEAMDLAAYPAANGFLRATVVQQDGKDGGVVVFSLPDGAADANRRL